MNIIKIEKCSSTNNYLKNVISQNNDNKNYVIKTSFQSSGKGQGDNVWESEYGKNLTFSFNSIKHGLDAVKQFYITATVSISVCETISSFLPKEKVKIKWPNDIYVGNKKITGILIENDVVDNIIKECYIGIGINVNQRNFVSNAPNPISLIHFLDQETETDEVLRVFLEKYKKNYDKLKSGDFDSIREKYLSKLFRINEEHSYIIGEQKVQGVILGIDEYGFLELESNGIVKSYDIKEVKYLFPTL